MKLTDKYIKSDMVPLDDLLPDPRNPNVLPPEMFEKLKVHLRSTGLYPYLIARPHPEIEGKYQLIDGHHRAAALREIGHTTARCDVWDVNDREAKILLATLNRLEGQDQPIRRAQLLHELLGEMSIDDLAGLLPETDRQLEELHSLLEFPADEIAALLEEQAAEEDKILPRVLTYVVSAEQQELIEQAVELASDGTVGRDRKARGLAALARTFLDRREGNESQSFEST